MKQDSADQRLGFLVRMGLSSFAGSVKDQGVGQIEAVRVQGGQRIETGGLLAGNAEPCARSASPRRG
jgi:hypothetical protein